MKTKEKILLTALELFNQTNSQAATTNHIAKAMGISPGNLHYHYKNREEIVRHLYQQMRDEMTLKISDLPKTIIEMDTQVEITAVLQWKYRFFMRELLFLLSRDSELKQNYIKDNIAHKERIIISLKDIAQNGCLDIELDDIFVFLADQLLITSHFWIAHEETLGVQLSKENLDKVRYQIQVIFRPYLTKYAIKELSKL